MPLQTWTVSEGLIGEGGGVKKADAAGVSEAAKGLMHADKLSIVVVGEADRLRDDLAKIAPVTVLKPPSAKAEKGK